MTTRPFFVAGEWRRSDSVKKIRSPFDDALVDEHFAASMDDVDDALEAAADVHARGAPPRHVRSAWLSTAAAIAEQRAAMLADLLVAEGGKPLKAATLEVARLISTLRSSAEEAKRLDGEILPLDTSPSYGSRIGLVTRVPIGPVLGITPFNFPLNLVAHKVGPALAAGCPIVVKPASATPLSALALAEIFEQAGLDPGYLSVVPIGGAAIEAAVSDPRVAKVSFTGSPEVGWRLKSLAGRARVTLELGGNAATVLCADADLAFAAKRIAWGGFYQAGQSCISVQRIYVSTEAHDAFLGHLVRAVEDLSVGDPADPGTDVGPLIDRAALDRVSGWVDEAIASGARALTGARREDPLYHPTVLVDVKPDMKVVCEEVFGPVVTVSPFGDFTDAIDEVNRSRFGLQASVFTNDVGRIFEAFRRLQVGGVVANDVPSWRADEMPYGGVKESGSGREGIAYAIGEMTEPRLLVLNGVQM